MSPTPSATEKLKAAVTILQVIGETVREAGVAGIPSGHLYTALMGKVSLEDYEKALGILERAELVKELPSHLLIWTGPVLS